MKSERVDRLRGESVTHQFNNGQTRERRDSRKPPKRHPARELLLAARYTADKRARGYYPYLFPQDFKIHGPIARENLGRALGESGLIILAQ